MWLLLRKYIGLAGTQHNLTHAPDKDIAKTCNDRTRTHSDPTRTCKNVGHSTVYKGFLVRVGMVNWSRDPTSVQSWDRVEIDRMTVGDIG